VLFRSMILTYSAMCREHGHQHQYYFLTRTHPYETSGRFQSEDEARQIDDELRRYLKELGMPVMDVPASDEGVSMITNHLRDQRDVLV
jgi:predicted ATPase